MKLFIRGFLLFLLSTASCKADDPVEHFSVKLGTVQNNVGLMRATFLVKNDNDFAIADVRITCVVYAQSGTDLQVYNLAIYETFAAKSSRSVKNIKIGLMPEQGKSMSCIDTMARKSK